jgi:indole-3-glycerol phosphate synthase
MTTILDEIVAAKRREVADRMARVPREALAERLARAPRVHDFRAALCQSPPIRLIAEVKKASPSAGVIRANFDPVAIASMYAANGASCVSVLTDESYFGGSLEHLSEIRKRAPIPLLRKDFIIDDYQILEARCAGADAILLIAEILDDAQLRRFIESAKSLGIRALVELYEEPNLARVLAAGAEIVGINNRDLRRFETDLEHTFRLRDRIPPGIPVVSESGICRRRDVERLEAAGVAAILVGEHLMRAPDIGQAVRRLLGSEPEGPGPYG